MHIKTDKIFNMLLQSPSIAMDSFSTLFFNMRKYLSPIRETIIIFTYPFRNYKLPPEEAAAAEAPLSQVAVSTVPASAVTFNSAFI